LKKQWDIFVEQAKNGLFLFFRDYMDYHADRFADASLMFYEGAHLFALLPASIHNGVLSSHAGLTFGGVLSDERMTVAGMLEVFERIVEHARSQRIKSLVYKAIPYPFCRLPAQEDLYALFRAGATLIRRDVSSVIKLATRLEFSSRRRRGLNKAAKERLSVSEGGRLESFMPILAQALERHGVKPVHTLTEMQRLQSRFPQNIRLFSALDNDSEMLAGTLVYEYGRVAHTQYIASSDRGRKLGALDLIVEHLVNHYYPSKADYLSFGISTEKEGRVLNTGLCTQKEEFGARAVAHDFYSVDLAG
jgi:hypothetical protein